MSVAVKDCIDLIRSKGGLKSWTDGQIAATIMQSLGDYAITFTTNAEGALDGILFGKWENSDTLYIYYATGRMKEFISYYRHMFPDLKYYKGMRGDKILTYKL